MIRIVIALGLATYPALATAQTVLPSPPVHSRSLLLVGDRVRDIALGRLEPGRTYRMQITLDGQSSPADGAVEARLDDSFVLIRDALNRTVYHLAVPFSPESRGPLHLGLRGIGEMGSMYRVQVTWQAEAEPRMASVDYIPSPNQGVRPPDATVTAIVVHATVTPTREATVNWFLNQASQVSAHYVVGRDGHIVQMVDDTGRAWHAGVSELEGVKNVNNFSVGIEIVNLNDGKDPYTDAQYEAVAAIIRHVRDQYPVPDSRIVSHEFVARPKGRKNDPKGFDFPRLLRLSRNPE
jgi:N-acetylmuramoyl-L-alanine amidase